MSRLKSPYFRTNNPETYELEHLTLNTIDYLKETPQYHTIDDLCDLNDDCLRKYGEENCTQELDCVKICESNPCSIQNIQNTESPKSENPININIENNNEANSGKKKK